MTRDGIVERIAAPVARLACQKCGGSIDVSDRPMLSPISCPECGKKQAVPARLSGFLLIAVLGRGGMASVYRAFDETLGRMVAIKILRLEVQENAGALQNFMREARAAAKINHPNIVQVYTVGQAKGQAFLVMELLDGGRLDEIIAADRSIDEVRVLEIALGVAEGLKSANEAGLIHGDIKPANILFDRAGTPKIADFGLARFKGSVTARSEVWGTPYYIAPETVRKQKEDHRADIYSLGATLYHALGGQPPFEGKTATDVVVARLKEPPLRIDELRPSLHPETVAVVSRMLETDRARRYPTYASLIADVHRSLDAAQASRVRPGGASRRSSRKRLLVWAGMALGVLAGLGVVAWWVWRSAPEEKEEMPREIPAAEESAVDPETTGPQPVQPDPNLLLQPFTPEEGALLAEAIRWAGARPIEELEQTFISQVMDLERDHDGRPWYAFWYGFSAWISGDAEETEHRLRPLRERTFEPRAEGVPAPGALAQALAHVLGGEPFSPPGPRRADPEPAPERETADTPGRPDAPAESGPATEEREPLPDWYMDLADFTLGLRELSAADTRGMGRARLARYLESPETAGVSWAYAGKEPARRWIEMADAWDALLGTLRSHIDAGEGDRVLADLETRIRDPAWGLLKADMEAALRNARRWKTQYDQRIEHQRRQAAEAALREKMASERLLWEGLQSKVLPFLRQLDFSAALTFWTERMTSIETEEVRADAAAFRDALAQMNRLKRFLGREARRRPYELARRELMGDVVQITDSGVTVMLQSGAGVTDFPWSRVGPRVFSDMAVFYLSATAIPERERGDLAAGLAVFFHLNQAVRPAAAAPANAIRWNPEWRDRLRRILPDTIAEPDG